MENTAQPMNNTNSFTYPDFSGGVSATPAVNQQTIEPQIPSVPIANPMQTQPLQQTQNMPSMLDKVTTPTPVSSATPQQSSPIVSTVDTLATTLSHPSVSQDVQTPASVTLNNEASPLDSVLDKVSGVVLPSNEEVAQSIAGNEVDAKTAFSTVEPVQEQQTGFVPPLNISSLESIMPDARKPKAVDRNPKENNLATPMNGEEERENLIKSIGDDLEAKTPTPTGSAESSTVHSSNGKLKLNDVLAEAINRDASDMHLAVGYPVIYRVDGELVELNSELLTPEDVESLVFECLVDEKKEILEVNREVDFAYAYKGSVNYRFRVNAYYSMKNLAAAFRLIPARVRTIEELDLPQIYHQMTKTKQGLILVTGPTGSGKTSTLAAFLEDINRNRFCHIVTIEDPVEYVFEGKKALIDQREMNDDTYSWAVALKSALRQDPDVILVGEMRDYETISAAITLAETGHLVFATLHTNSAAQTVDRIIDVFPENQQQQVRSQLSNSLEAVIAQRLIPLDKGGRKAVSEIMFNNSAVANLIREGNTHQIDNVIRTSADIGMTYLEKSLVSMVRSGDISIDKAQEYAVHPEEVLRLLKV